MKGLHGLIFAYEPERALGELMAHRFPATLPVGGRYRAIDFMLSNLRSAGATEAGVVMNGDCRSLLNHLGNGKIWDMARKFGGLRVLPASMAFDGRFALAEFRGWLEAIAGLRGYIEGIRQDHVLLVGGNLVANLPLKELLAEHIDSGADITALCTETYDEDHDASYFVANDQGRVEEIYCDTHKPRGYRAMNVYLLSRELLIRLAKYGEKERLCSFRRDVLNAMRGELNIRVRVWNEYFAILNSIPSYFRCNMEMLQESVRDALFRTDRPILGKETDLAPSYFAPGSHCRNSLVTDGCEIEGEVENSVLFPGVSVERGAKVRNAILFRDVIVRKDATISYAIADKRVEISQKQNLIGKEDAPFVISKDGVV